eukprot:CAMPEP_0202419102 /NCGR_PEP_ID=MMETSP1128-20130828/48388_1 /ASSEMBLY_ACC=CAM_ASM_000463 /TAXON_ID=3047 /ORGANISM="Dunaliella tertiolecta, Strain CCMP1320" /LENGTH=34 /DNA_ID= /DNA_START= /DNA_END= /DNA_ORIENTATION=
MQAVACLKGSWSLGGAAPEMRLAPNALMMPMQFP